MKIVIATGGTVGLAKGIIDDTCLAENSNATFEVLVKLWWDAFIVAFLQLMLNFGMKNEQS